MKRIRYLFRYIRLLKRHKQTLLDSRINNNSSGIRYDWLYRLYTVLNLPPDDEENIKRYGYYYVDNMVKNHIARMNEFLLELGILEFVRIDTDNVIQLDDFNVKIVLRFRWLNLKGLFRTFLFGIPIIILIGILLLVIL